MILKARHHPIVHPFFKMYTLWTVSRHFRQVFISGEYVEKGLAVLMIANHAGWWDGFWLSYLNLKRFRRKFHFLMKREQLEQYPILQKTGGYSVTKGSRSILETLDYTAELLENTGNAVVFFPQGRIQSMYTRDFRFDKGIEKILKRVGKRIHLIFVANLIEYSSHPKPCLYIYLSEYQGNDLSAAAVEHAYNGFYDSCITQHQQMPEP